MSIKHHHGRVASPTLHATAFFTVGVFVACVTMSYFFKVEIVAKGIGKIVPLGRVQVVQPEFGGQITAIHVKNGMAVARGELLIQLDPTNDQAEVNTLTAEKSRLESERQRIATVVRLLPDAQDISQQIIARSVSEFQALGNPLDDYHQEQANLLAAELEELSDTLAQIDSRITANRKSEDVTRAGIARSDSAITTQQERLDVTKALLDKGTTSRAVYLDVLDGFNRLEKDREIYQRELQQKSSQELAYRNEKSSVVSGFRSRLLTRRTELEARLFELEEQLVASQRRLNNAQLFSPVDGVIDQLEVYTVGGIVNAGQELMRVVPQDQAYEIEAMFPNTDVGFLKIGQRANIRLDAFPSERFGALEGKISSVSADAIELSENKFGFVVRIKPEVSYLQTPGNQYAIQAGMTSVVDAITGERRIISYFFAPLVKVVQESMGER
ncbi:HlyD family type I secretion periplasmic adaptor subunit [Sulfitobacter sp.]|uniref:HlyD family type I secretion periplasmic adaptor subunit n=1 Tax=Sulfitobacter sp. TaxID=1903071 RepID=UPI003EF4DC56